MNIIENYINGNLKDAFYWYKKINNTATFWVFVETNYGNEIKNNLMNYFSRKERGV